MSKQFLGILAAVVIGLGLIFWISSGHKNSSHSNNQNSSKNATNHVEGQGSKGVTLVEYGDYECPVCEAYYSTVKQVAAKYNNDIFFQFRNLPLVQIHPNAFAAARAAEAAGMQNKYFQMHDMLYEQQNSWANLSNPLPVFQGFAQQLGLDLNKFNSDYASSSVNDVINADVAEFNKTGQQEATPSFFVNNVYVSNEKLIDNNGPSVDKFSQVINAAIAAKK